MNNAYDIIIIGSGPSGVTAANLLAAKGMEVLIIEKGKDLIRRRDPASGWFGRGVFTMGRLHLNDAKLRNAKTFKEALEIVRKITSWKADIPRKKYCIPPADCGYKLASYYLKTLAEKTDILFNTEAIAIGKNNSAFAVKTDHGVFFAPKCLLTPGRNAVEWVEKICEPFDIECVKDSVEVGVRVEIPTALYSKVVNSNEDIPLDHGEISCQDTCHDSFISEWDESGILSAFAHTLPAKKSDRTSFMVGFEPIDVLEAIRIIKIVNVLANDRVRKERVADYMEQKSVLQHLDLFRNLQEAFAEIHAKMPAFIDYAAMYVPEVKLKGLLPVNAKMKTKVSGLYGAGECTTRVSTLVGAMASGLIAARTILGE